VSAAHCAIDLQETIAAIDATRAQLPDPPQLRIAAHIGPVYEVHDAVRGAPGFVGTHITRTARIEPRTPEGSVYVTDPFAAMITLAADATLTCQYVGHIPTAKEYGTFPMYVLKASSSHRGA
jgi:class 3 adenylate cyclase